MRSESRLSAMLLAVPTAVYLLWPSRNFYWDGMAFAIQVEKQQALAETLHPNHLIYTPIWVWLYRMALALGLEARAIFLMQAANSLLAAACLGFVFRALRRREFSLEASLGGSLALAFAATWWRYATDANAYIPSIFLLLVANDLLETRRRAVLAALAHCGAMLFHELAILYLPVMWFRLRDRKSAIACSAVSLGPVAAAYLASYRAVIGRTDLPGLWAWTTGHASDASFSFHPVRDLGFTLLGTLRLFFGGKLNQMAPGLWSYAGLALLACALGVLVVRLARGRLRFTVPSPDMLVWPLLYIVFLFFWMPQNTFYRLFYLPPAIVALCLAMRPSKAERMTPLLPAAVLLLWNGVFLIAPQSRVENNVPLRFALAQAPEWPAGTPIAFHQFHPDLWTISYFNPQASWIGLDTLDLQRLDESLVDARRRGQALWLEATAYEFLSSAPDGRAWIDAHKVQNLLRFRDAKHEFRYYKFE